MYKKRMAQLALTLIVISLLVFVALIILVRYHSVLQADIFLSRDLQAEGDTATRRNAIYLFFSFVSFFGRTLVAAAMVVITAAIFWLCRFYRETIFVLLVPISSVIGWLVKFLVARPRPSDGLVKVWDRQVTASFPSGHVVFYTVFFGFLIAVMFYHHKINTWLRLSIIIISLFFIAAISFSRIYLGAHWASDVAGGYLLGFACLMVLVYYYLKDGIA